MIMLQKFDHIPNIDTSINEKIPASSVPVTVTIITLNEESLLAGAIKSVLWAKEIIVVDSGSTDGTVKLAKKLGASVYTNEWKGYGHQKNFAMSKASLDWVLNIDADERVTAGLAKEIIDIISLESQPNEIKGFFMPRKTFYLGRWIMHGGWYPNYLVRMSRRNFSKWTEPVIHEELQVQGKTSTLKNDIVHFPFSGLEDQVRENLKYASLGSFELKKRKKSVSLLHLLLKPLGKFLETFIIKKGFLDGIPGFMISINAAHSMFLKYAFCLAENLNADSNNR